jgi:hypothetical protein
MNLPVVVAAGGLAIMQAFHHCDVKLAIRHCEGPANPGGSLLVARMSAVPSMAVTRGVKGFVRPVSRFHRPPDLSSSRCSTEPATTFASGWKR